MTDLKIKTLGQVLGPADPDCFLKMIPLSPLLRDKLARTYS